MMLRKKRAEESDGAFPERKQQQPSSGGIQAHICRTVDGFHPKRNSDGAQMQVPWEGVDLGGDIVGVFVVKR